MRQPVEELSPQGGKCEIRDKKRNLPLMLIRFHQLKFKIPIRLATARTHLQPITNLLLHFLQSFTSGRCGDSNGADILAFVLNRPGATRFRNSAYELHDLNHSRLLYIIHRFDQAGVFHSGPLEVDLTARVVKLKVDTQLIVL